MNKFTTAIKTQILSASLLVLAAATAHAGSKSVTYPVTLGGTQIGAKATYGVTVQNGSTLASFAATASGTGSLLGTNSNLVSLSITDTYSSGKPSINATYTVGSYTVASTTSTSSLNATTTVSQTFLSVNSTLPVTVGAVTYSVALKGTLAGSGAIAISAKADTTAKSVTVNGTVSDTVAGTVTASLPASTGATASSSSSNLNLGTSTLSTNSTVSTAAMSGSTNLSLNALNLSLKVLINSIRTGANIATVNLATYVATARTVLLLSL